MKVKISGLNDIRKVLTKLPQELGKKVTSGALRKGGNVIRDRAIANVPYSGIDRATKFAGEKSYYHKHLREQISVRTIKTDHISVRMIVTVGKAFWGSFLEFGTSRQPARPWMRPAFETSKESALTTIIENLGKGLEKTAEKLAGSLGKSGLVKRRRR